MEELGDWFCDTELEHLGDTSYQRRGRDEYYITMFSLDAFMFMNDISDGLSVNV